LLPADVADADALEAAAEQVEIKLGAIDVWINNAMTGVFSPIKEMTAAEFKRVTEVTFTSPAPVMRASKQTNWRTPAGLIIFTVRSPKITGCTGVSTIGRDLSARSFGRTFIATD
jgi:NAD(P)-dependent dehydrogenase (short-subunit alcohol dehydrogenase family)